MQRYGFFVKPPNVSATFFKKKFVFTAFYGVLQGKTRWERTEKLPQMSQIYTDAAAWEKPPTEYTDITEPTAENILPQISLCTDANFRGCTCLRSALPLARARSAPTEQYWYTSYFVFVYMICIVACCGGFHLRYGWVRTLTASEFRGFCGRYTHPNNLCRSVKSVGEYHSKKVLWVLWILWEEITVRRFCEYQWNLWEKITVRRFCADLWNLWENITARRFCEFCEICGRKSQ